MYALHHILRQNYFSGVLPENQNKRDIYIQLTFSSTMSSMVLPNSSPGVIGFNFKTTNDQSFQFFQFAASF